jgi:hypothetical protein
VYIPSSGAPPPATPAHEPSGPGNKTQTHKPSRTRVPTSRRCGGAASSTSRSRGRSRHPLGSRSRSSHPRRVRGLAHPLRRRSRARIARIPRRTELRRPNSPPIRRSQLPSSASPPNFLLLGSGRERRGEERDLRLRRHFGRRVWVVGVLLQQQQ